MTSATRLHGLDALRGIAALCVVGLHAQAVFGGFPGWFAKGYLAVDFFLMLSGFMMARVSEPRLAAGLRPARFMRARYRRFWSMIALGSLIGIPYLWVRAKGIETFVPALIANFLLLPWPVGRLLFALNIPAWTIFFELVANAAHVFALRCLGIKALAALTGLMLALTIYVALHFGSIDVGARPENFIAGFPRIFLAYLLGILLCRKWGDVPALPIPHWLALVAMPAAILTSWWTGYRHWSFDLGFVLLLCPLIIMGGLRVVRQTWLGWLSGAISFPLFAVHLPILEGMRELGFGVTQAVPLALFTALVITWWTNRPAPRRDEPKIQGD